MKLEFVRLKDLNTDSNRIYVKLREGRLVRLLKESSGKDLPHRDKKFCKSVGVHFNKKIKVSSTVVAWVKFNRAIPLSKLKKLARLAGIDLMNIEKDILSLRQHFRGGEISIKFPLKIVEKVGSVVGHILGDGSIDKKYQQIFFSNSQIQI